ncbi:MAG: sigma-70 family RNA polymerase sigma factor [Oxalicibacterium faecigallinarum]|nr:sigma-70 family RNA polymerase sigma factor [Oxalicibacterium faecigallinarum]MDQ7970047.1 sigma-70 family RNA polymerase sigma factor [Oxalicibacterium faecigallinarum]
MSISHSTDSIADIYSQHHGWLLRWLRGKLRCADQAADLAQDTFLRLLTTPVEQRGLREPRAYLTTVAQRLVIDHYRRQSLEQAWLETLALMPEPIAPSPEDRMLMLETLHRIDAMLDGLLPQVRSTFLLSQLEGLAYADIAKQLGISERTVKRYMVQAFERCILLIV